MVMKPFSNPGLAVALRVALAETSVRLGEAKGLVVIA
jgi:hypothetical protein